MSIVNYTRAANVVHNGSSSRDGDSRGDLRDVIGGLAAAIAGGRAGKSLQEVFEQGRDLNSESVDMLGAAAKLGALVLAADRGRPTVLRHRRAEGVALLAPMSQAVASLRTPLSRRPSSSAHQEPGAAAATECHRPRSGTSRRRR